MNGVLEQLRFFRPGWGDVVEILIVAFLCYRILLLLQRTRALQVLLGVGLVTGFYGLARLLQFDLIRTMLEFLFQYGAIAALVVFQPELRSALARLGQSRMIRFFSRMEEHEFVEELLDGVDQLSRSKTGALIAIEGQVDLEEYARTGSRMRAQVSADLLATIFTPLSPLHDGAVIISGDQIRAAGAILPLTQTPLSDRSLGTRHRAALGLSEETDAVVIVVSEETARVSVAYGGRLEVDLDRERLREIAQAILPEGDGRGMSSQVA